MRSSYLDYSMSVIIGRALPDVRDGLKPVHRRILYAMHNEGNTSSRRYSKCAGVVGEVLKKYHPHGDSAVYDALVRMAQPWNLRYLLVDGQGNFGSIDGDPPAAYRYTESRMMKLAEYVLADIDKDTVNFEPNFDGSTEEPTVLPAAFPNLLVNGSDGIAVGMATKIPPHNLGEIIDGVTALIRKPRAQTSTSCSPRSFRVPTSPPRATIYGRQGIRDAYGTGRGRVVVRGHRPTSRRPQQRSRRRSSSTEMPVPGEQGAPHRAGRRPGQGSRRHGGHPRPCVTSPTASGMRDRDRAQAATRSPRSCSTTCTSRHGAADDVRRHPAGDRATTSRRILSLKEMLHPLHLSTGGKWSSGGPGSSCARRGSGQAHPRGLARIALDNIDRGHRDHPRVGDHRRRRS